MRLGGTVCCDHPAEWENRLVQSGFRAITAPFTCDTPREETERLLRIIEKHDTVIAEVGVWRNPFDPAEGSANLDYAVRQLQLAENLSVPCCVNIAGTESPFGWDAADPGNFSDSMYRRLVASIREIIGDERMLHVQTTRTFGESTVAKILELVENSSSNKSRSENFISRFARVYTPAVVFGALALALLPPLVRLLLGLPALWSVWVYRALTFLVISCPCALVISIPLSFFAGIGGASRAGILVKGSNYLETLSQVKTVVFDKTGTITRGVFEVSGIHHCQIDEDTLIEYAALAECASSHPISQSLRRHYGKEPDRSRVSDIEEISGRGVLATVDGVRVAAGNDKLMDQIGVPFIPCRSAGTVIHVALDGQYAGHILISDVEKDDVKEALAALRAAGVEKTVMLTGDGESAARQVAERVGIDEYHSGLLPGDKVALVEQMLARQDRKARLAFVGDGINDAPVLSRADIGIAMGALGSDAAIEAADIVLMDDDPLKISKAIQIARKCLRIVYQNIVFALAVKFGCLLLGALGLAGMWAAIFADVGVMVLAVLNAMRALNTRGL